MSAWQQLCFIGVLLVTPLLGQEKAKQPPPAANGRAETPAIKNLAKQAADAREHNRTEEAIALYVKALKLDRSWRDGWWLLGTVYYEQDRYGEGRDAFRRLTSLDPSAPAGWAMLGLCEFETRDYPQALAHLERANALGLPSGDQLTDVIDYHLALLLTRNEQYEQAAAILTRFAKLGRQEPQFVEAFGIAALRKPLLPSEVPPTERELIMDTGRAVYDATARRSTEAQTEFQSLLENYPKQPNLHFLYAAFLLQSDPDQALEQMKAELELSPEHLPTLVSIAAEYLRRKEYQSGLPYAQKAVASAPQSFAAHSILGQLLTAGNIDQALGMKELEEAKKLAPDSPQTRFALATAYARVGRKADAARERSEFLRLQNLSKEKTAEQ